MYSRHSLFFVPFVFAAVVVAVMYDQATNGKKVEALGLGKCVDFDSLLEDCASISGHQQYDITAEKSVAGHLVSSGIPPSRSQRLEQLLAGLCAPPQRLRCACVGRDVRADPAEDGLTNAVALLKDAIDNALTVRSSVPLTSVESSSMSICDSNKCVESLLTKEMVLGDDGIVQFPNGLRACVHIETAAEETAFLYEEIFERQVYRDCVEHLQDGDIVIDAGTACP